MRRSVLKRGFVALESMIAREVQWSAEVLAGVGVMSSEGCSW